MTSLDCATAEVPIELRTKLCRSLRRTALSSLRRNSYVHLDHAGQSGVGLIEVLVAVLVLSIGFLGVAALQAMSLSTNNSAMARSLATISSYSILDAMRVDRVTAVAKGYDGTVTANACPAKSATLASVQLNQWCTQLGHDLGPTAATTGMISCQGNGECTVTITFDDSRAGVGGTNNQQVVTKGIL